MQDFALVLDRLVSFPISWFYLKLTYNHISHCPAIARTHLPTYVAHSAAAAAAARQRPASCVLVLDSCSLFLVPRGRAGQLHRLHPFAQPSPPLPKKKKFLQHVYVLILHVARTLFDCGRGKFACAIRNDRMNFKFLTACVMRFARLAYTARDTTRLRVATASLSSVG